MNRFQNASSVPALLVFCIVLIGIGFPKAVAKVACRALVDFLVAIPGGVVFWFCRFGGVKFSPPIWTTGRLLSLDYWSSRSPFGGSFLLRFVSFLWAFLWFVFPVLSSSWGWFCSCPVPVISPDLIFSLGAPFLCAP